MLARVTPSNGPLADLRAKVLAAAAAASSAGGPEHELPAHLRMERSKRAGQGDYSTNAAMLLAPGLGLNPREMAERIGKVLSGLLGEDLDRVDVAGPGFLNLFLSDKWHRGTLRAVLDAGERLGTGTADPAQRIIIEFVSANPTGPLVAASGRHAAYGDALARILGHQGHEVWREYYFNDAGNQIRLLGESVRARARGEEVPEGGYQGEYVHDLARDISGAGERDPDELAEAAVQRLLAQIRASLERYGVRFDKYFSERELHSGSPSAVDRALAVLEEAGHVYRSDGAAWLRTTTFGDDKDRVVVRSNGEPTYLAADIAYLLNKLERGYERQLMPVGSDHHAYVRELKAAMAALGGDPDAVEIPILQFVHLVHDRGVLAMSKRAGSFVRLDDLLDAIGVDATRFFMLRSSHDRTLDLDLELAARQSAENPVYYVQYAHARIASMLRKVGSHRVHAALEAGADWGTVSLEPSEGELIKRIAAFPEEVAEAAERRGPHRIVSYCLDLARDFTSFYERCRVVGAQPAPLESFRLALSLAAQRTIATSLGLLGVSAPESM
jgi:arginyl-tRNA synthetase